MDLDHTSWCATAGRECGPFVGCDCETSPAAGSSVPDTSGQPETVEGGIASDARGEDVTLVVRKLGYSSRPWRIVAEPCPAGENHRASRCACELWTTEPFAHPNLGDIVIDGPVAFDRKRDAVAYLELRSGTTADSVGLPEPAPSGLPAVREPDEAARLRELAVAALPESWWLWDSEQTPKDGYQGTLAFAHAATPKAILALLDSHVAEVAVLTARLTEAERKEKLAVETLTEIVNQTHGVIEESHTNEDAFRAEIRELREALTPYVPRLPAYAEFTPDAEYQAHITGADIIRARAALAGERGDRHNETGGTVNVARDESGQA